LFVLGQLVHLVVDLWQLDFNERQLGEARIVEDGYRGAVLLGQQDVIYVDVILDLIKIIRWRRI
ncbi:hypothetical protein, partial [Pseudomonas sp. Pseusp97]|uniref:hypothetical protein n=1 Tax=Pseudomonas sp. Pseusp97 TaxID=3243065 RepID=UPI0039A72CC1